MLKIYGLKNCDTCRAARNWLKTQDVEHEFIDIREGFLDVDLISGWIADVGLEVLLNKRGTTWRKLDEAKKQPLSEAAAIKLMLAHPTLIKRPVFSSNGRVSVGFPKDDKAQEALKAWL